MFGRRLAGTLRKQQAARKISVEVYMFDGGGRGRGVIFSVVTNDCLFQLAMIKLQCFNL